MRSIRPIVPCSVLVALLAGSVLGQGSGAPLAGPGVEDREVPGVREVYRPGQVGSMDDAARAVPLRVYLGALAGLAGSDDALSSEQSGAIRDELRLYREELSAFLERSGGEVRAMVDGLPEEQRGRVLAEFGELRGLVELLDRVDRTGGVALRDREARDRRRERGGNVAGGREPGERPERGRLSRRDRGKAEPAPGERRGAQDEAFRLDLRERAGDGEPMPDSGMMMEERGSDGAPAGDLREMVMSLRNRAPSVAALETRLWELLTEPQQAVVGEAVEGYLSAQQERVQESRLRREVERREAEAAARREQSDRAFAFGDATRERVLEMLDRGEIPEQLWERLPERLRSRLEGVPADRRAEALARLVRSRADRGSDRP